MEVRSIEPSGLLSFGVHELSAGDHKLMIEVTGINEKAEKAYQVRTDYLKLEELK